MLVLAIVAITADKPATLNYRTEVDGKKYRVEVKGRTVEVYHKAALTGRTPERGDRLRRAVTQATGCKLTEEYWAAAHLRGILDCADKRTPLVP